MNEIINKIDIQLPKSIYNKIESKIDGKSYRSLNGMFIIFSVSKELDDNIWLHVSFSRKGRIPNYSDIQQIKKHFIGNDKKAIMIFPENENHVNIHPYCLHLWHCINKDVLPDFTQGYNSI